MADAGRAALAVVMAYVVGSLPSAHAVAVRSGVDLRRAGSGNVGAANAFRTLGAARAALVAALDIAKGVAAVLLARAVAPDGWVAAAAVAAIAGQIHPIWLGFRGGKGVATSFGVFTLLSPAGAAAGALTFAAVAASTRVVSLASLAATAAFAALLLATPVEPSVRAAGLGCAALLVYSHRANIARLVRGSEPRLVSARPGTTPARVTPDGSPGGPDGL